MMDKILSCVRFSAMLAVVALMVGGLVGCAEAPVQKDTSNLVWPQPPDKPRVKFVAEYRGQTDFSRETFKASLLGVESAGLVLQKPYGVATNKAGNQIFVTDTKGAMVMVFDLEARKVVPFVTDSMGGMSNPTEVRLDSKDRVYVTDSARKEALIFSPDGKTLKAVGKAEGMERPTGLALDEVRNKMYISDTTKHRVLVYDMDGKYLRTIGGERGGDPGQLNFPINLVVDKSGNLFVTDTGNFRVQVFSPDGQFVRMFGQLGDAVGSFTRPKGIGIDSDGNVYVVDAAFNNFQIFNQEGQTLLFVGQMGREPGTFWLPAGMYIDAADRIYVVDSINARVQVFQYIKYPKEGVVDEAKKQ